MGDRSNIVVEDHYNLEPGSDQAKARRVYLYSHWDGERIVKHAITALTGDRVGDTPYFTRAVVQSMIRDDLDGTTGVGISTQLTDNEHPILVISSGTATFAWFEDEEGKALTPKDCNWKKFLETMGTIGTLEEVEDLADGNELYEILIPMLNKSQ